MPPSATTDPTTRNLHDILVEAVTVRGLRAYDEADTLIFADIGIDGREHRLTPAATAAWLQLRDAAVRAGVDIRIASSFRSVARQTEIIAAKLAQGELIDDILRAVAPPGYSEHHTGRAIDIVTPAHPELDVSFATTSAYAWLAEHAAQYRFTLSYPEGNEAGYQYEPWHWCFQAPNA